ncbi:MAG: AzlD domain-containing protein [Oscillospiraceae bacterium]|nr:AzlD domain-containing protein [Oscillospiraceae bacterium]
MKISYILMSIAVMAGVTYLIRAIPILVFRKKIENRWIRSFLFYVPYVVLAAMTFPAVLYSTGSIPSAAVGSAVGIILAYKGAGLLTVAASSALAAFVMLLFNI